MQALDHKQKRQGYHHVLLTFSVLMMVMLIGCVKATELSASEKTAILNAHNQARSSASPAPLTKLTAMEWSDDLSSKAATWLTKCLAGPSVLNSVTFGENIHMNMKSNVSMLEVVNSWTSESEKYDLSNNYCSVSRFYLTSCHLPMQSGDCQHYIQVVAAVSVKVGCARVTCPKISNKPEMNGATIIVCNYSPKPNVLDRPYVKVPVCPTPSCGNGVCKSVSLSSAQCVCNSGYMTVNASAPCTACSNTKYTGASCDKCATEGMVYPSCLKCSENLMYANGICIPKTPTCGNQGCGNGTCLYSSSYTPYCTCNKGYTSVDGKRPCSDCAEGFQLSDSGVCQRICPTNYFGTECQYYRPQAQCIIPPKTLLIGCADHINYMINTDDMMDQLVSTGPADYQTKLGLSISTKVSSLYKKNSDLLTTNNFKNCGDSCRKALLRVSCLKTFKSCSVNSTNIASSPLCSGTCKNIVTGEMGLTPSIANDYCSTLNVTNCFSVNSTQSIKCFGLSSESPLACSGNGKCGATDTCVCNQGYSGVRCQNLVCFQKESTDPSVCSGNGKCIGPDNCICKEKYSGEMCDIPTCNGRTEAQGGCSFRGKCSLDGRCTCSDNFAGSSCSNCKEGFSGTDCQTPICGQLPATDKNVCGGRGACTQPNTCTCSDGYTGPNCATFTCNGIGRYESSVCSKKGKCIGKDICTCYGNYDNTTFCSTCLPSFGGEECRTPRCSSDTCNNRGNCTQNMKCECEERFAGAFCEKCANGFVGVGCEVSCTPALTCSNRGVCLSDGSCKCLGHSIGTNCSTCAQGWYGSRCDFSVVDNFELSEKADIIYGTVYSSIKSIIPCQDLIRPESIDFIGKGASCMLNGESKLTIILGYGSSIAIGQNLSVSLYPQSTDAMTITIKQGAFKPTSPEAQINVEKSVVSRGCDKLFINAANSQSFDRRPLKFTWQVISAPSTDDFLTLSSMISSIKKPNLMLETNNLNNGTYSIQVVVNSPLAPEITSSQTISFIVSEDSIPNLSIKEGLSISNTLGLINIVTPVISYSTKACNKGRGHLRFIYSMNLDYSSADNITNFIVEDGRLIIGPGRTVLPREGDYYLLLTVRQDGVQDVSLPFKVTASSSPLKVAFNLRDVIQSYEDPVTLSVIAQDPSKTNEVSSVTLVCLNLDSGNICTNGTFPLDITNSLKMTQLMDSGSYLFTVTYKKQNRTATDSIKITLLEISKETVITSSIIPMDGVDLTVVNPSKDLVLRALLIQPVVLSEAKSFLWESSSIDLTGLDVSKAYMIIPSSLLTPGSSNEIKLTIKDTAQIGNTTINKEGTAEVFFTVNSPPTVGELIIEPSTGVALLTDFKISCGNGWTDAQLPLTFEFSTRNPNSNSWTIVSPRSETNFYSLKLGSIGTNQVSVTVYDSVGASSTAVTTVNVTEATLDETVNTANTIADQSNIPVSDGAALIQSIVNANYSQVNDSQVAEIQQALAQVADSVINTMLNNTQQEVSITTPTESSVSSTTTIIDMATQNLDMMSQNTTNLIADTLISNTNNALDSSINMNTDTLSQTQDSADALFTTSNTRSILPSQFKTQKPTEKLKQVYTALVNIASNQKVPDMPATILLNKDVKAYGRKVTKSFLNGLNETISGKNSFKLSEKFNQLHTLSNVTDSLDITLNVFKPNCSKALANAVEFVVSHLNSALNINHTESIAELQIDSTTGGSTRRLRGTSRSLLATTTTYQCLKWDDSVGDYVKDDTCTATQDSTSGSYILVVKSTGTFTVSSINDSPSNNTDLNTNNTSVDNSTISNNTSVDNSTVGNNTSVDNSTSVNNNTGIDNSTNAGNNGTVGNNTNSVDNSTSVSNNTGIANSTVGNNTNTVDNSTSVNNDTNSVDKNNTSVDNSTSGSNNTDVNNSTTNSNNTNIDNSTTGNNTNVDNSNTSSNTTSTNTTNSSNNTNSGNNDFNNSTSSNTTSSNSTNSNNVINNGSNSTNSSSPIVNNSTTTSNSSIANNTSTGNSTNTNGNTTNPVTPVTPVASTPAYIPVGGTLSVKTAMTITKAIPAGGALVMSLPSAFTLSSSRRALSDNFIVTNSQGTVIQFSSMSVDASNKLNATLSQTLSPASYTITMKVKVNSGTSATPVASIATYNSDGSSIESVTVELPKVVIPTVSMASKSFKFTMVLIVFSCILALL